MNEKPKVTFIICTYNRAGYLDDTLRSLLRHNFPASQAELLIVDNNSVDQTPKVVNKYQQEHAKDENRIRYIKELNQGLSHARNRGIKEARAAHVVFLDDDIIASESLIATWLKFFSDHPEALAGGGRIFVQFDDPRPSWMSHFLLPLLGHHDLGGNPKTYPQNKYPFGGNMGFKKAVFDEIGPFNTDLGRKGKSLNAGEEKELFRRLREKSAEIHYLPEALLYHRVGKERLTPDFIRKQALGLGQSMKLRMEDASPRQFLSNWLKEFGKFGASVPLGLYYLLELNPEKAKMLFQFRWWIWEGYKQHG